MITFEYARQRTILENGQFLVPSASLKLDDDKMEQIFVNSAKKLQNRRPIRTVVAMSTNPDGVRIPDALGVLALKYMVLNNFDRISPPLPHRMWSFDPATRILKSILTSTQMVVIYNREFKIGYFPQTENVMTTIEGEVQVDFYLSASFKQNSLKFTKTDYGTGDITEIVEVSRAGNIVTLGGTLGTGTLNLTTLKVHLELIDTSANDIIATYYNARRAVQDIEEFDLAFHTLFSIDVLKAYSSLKYQATMSENTGLPFSLQSDTLLDRIRVLEDQLQEYLKGSDFWWNWGY
jgi:hypothetical protein